MAPLRPRSVRSGRAGRLNNGHCDMMMHNLCVPDMKDNRDVGGGSGHASVAGSPNPAFVELLRRELRAGHPGGSAQAARLARRSGLGLPEIYDDVVRPIFDRIGDRWQHGLASVASEHRLSAAAREVVHALSADEQAVVAGPGGRGTVLLAPAPGERHVLGLTMLQHVLTVDGFEVLRVDEAPWQELARLAEDLSALCVVGISLHQCLQPTMLTNGLRAIRRARPGVRVMLGGLAVRRDPDLPTRVRANAGAGDLAQAIASVRSLVNPLTEREVAVLHAAAAGRSNAAIADGLGVSVSGIKRDLERILVKTGASDRTAAVAAALRRGWLT